MGPVLFLFHRDLRLEDNNALHRAYDYAKQHDTTVMCMFLFTPEQAGPKAPIRSVFSLVALLQSLEDLDDALRAKKSRLHIFYGKHEEIFPKLLQEQSITALFDTADYTPYARKRTAQLQTICDQHSIPFVSTDDLYLNAPGTVLNKAGKPYQKFTPYYETAKQISVAKPIPALPARAFFTGRSKIPTFTLAEIRKKILTETDETQMAYRGGRTEALKLLRNLPHKYDEIHDVLKESTSGLSVHHHYGTISVRESWWRAEELIRQGHTGLEAFQRQLYWRDFYGQIVAFFEDLYGTDAYEYQKDWPEWDRYSEATKREKREIFRKWCAGETGVPLVDAGMRQMNTTGFMHNRARLVCASWLIKDMGIHWRWGERYFAERLLDYDFSQNFGNWTWVASVLPYSQPPFRRHDPTTIAKRLDPNGEYVRHWGHPI
jgi:deoxyribodipyrimidine photo-lyase